MGSAPQRRSPLTDILLERIEREGRLTFAAFMEACLYHPEHGYYSRRAAAEVPVDYFTSPDVGPLFGRLLARQLREMWELLGRPVPFELVECGAGSGRLAAQLLGSIGEIDAAFSRALRVTLVEVSATLRLQTQAALAKFGEQVRFVAELPAEPVVGCIFSNELIDALPVHRVVQRAKGLREIYIGAKNGRLMEVEDALSSAEIARYLERYGVPLGEGQLAEISLAALAWLERVARALGRGFLLTVDYGYRARELYGPGHPRGTLLAYRGHRAHEDWLAEPGLVDLTAHVNFTALEERGRELGLATLGYTQQAHFLLALARACGFADLPGTEAREELKQLVHPGGMGEAFKVLIQGKGVEDARLSGLEPL